jgi:hypothetical protein
VLPVDCFFGLIEREPVKRLEIAEPFKPVGKDRELLLRQEGAAASLSF